MPSVDLGVTAISLRSTGVASTGFIGGASSAVTATPFARFGLAFALTPVLRLRADVIASVIADGVSIRLAERKAATWGKPLMFSSAVFDIGWF